MGPEDATFSLKTYRSLVNDSGASVPVGPNSRCASTSPHPPFSKATCRLTARESPGSGANTFSGQLLSTPEGLAIAVRMGLLQPPEENVTGTSTVPASLLHLRPMSVFESQRCTLPPISFAFRGLNSSISRSGRSAASYIHRAVLIMIQSGPFRELNEIAPIFPYQYLAVPSGPLRPSSIVDSHSTGLGLNEALWDA